MCCNRNKRHVLFALRLLSCKVMIIVRNSKTGTELFCAEKSLHSHFKLSTSPLPNTPNFAINFPRPHFKLSLTPL